jgi:hypothetical protein
MQEEGWFVAYLNLNRIFIMQPSLKYLLRLSCGAQSALSEAKVFNFLFPIV